MVATETEPLAVWDAREGSWWKPPRLARTAWLRNHGLPVDAIYRVEFYQADAPFARLFCYHLDDEGRKHWDGAHDAAAVEEPRDVPLSELPYELFG